MKPFFLILKIRKFILGTFLIVSFCKTSYFQHKLEIAAEKLLCYKLPRSELSGLKALSLTRWHIESLTIEHPNYGTFRGEDILFDLNWAHLLLGRCTADSLVIQNVVIKTDPKTPFNPQIFNTLYQSKSIGVNQCYIARLQVPLIPQTLSIHFLKKAKLNFLEVFDIDSKNHASFEIPKTPNFLKFKADFFLDLPLSGHLQLKGQGEITKSTQLHLLGVLKPPASEKQVDIDCEVLVNPEYSFKGSLVSSLVQGTYAFSNQKLTADLHIEEIKDLWPAYAPSGELNVQVIGPLSQLNLHATSQKFYYHRKSLAPLEIRTESYSLDASDWEASFLKNTAEEIKMTLSHQKKGDLQFTSSELLSQLFSGHVNLGWDQQALSFLKIESQFHDLKFFEGVLNNTPLSGRGNLILNYQLNDDIKELFSAFSELKIGSLKCEHGAIHFSETNQNGHLNAELQNLKTSFYEPLYVKLQGKKQGNWEIESHLKSSHLTLKAINDIKFTNSGFETRLAHLEGFLFNNPLILEGDVIFKRELDDFTLSKFAITSGQTSLSCVARKTKDDLLAIIHLNNVPLDGFKTPYFDAPLSGEVSLKIKFDSNNLRESTLNLNINTLKLTQAHPLFLPLFINASMQFSDMGINYLATSFFSNDDYCHLQGHIPVHWNPSHLFIRTLKPAHHFISLKYDLKDLGRLINLGSNSIGGRLSADLCVKELNGSLFTTGNASVDQLYAGFPLLGIYTENGTLNLTPMGHYASFCIQTEDLYRGHALAKGSLDLSSFSYNADVSLDQLFLKVKDVFETTLNGTVHASGNFKHLAAEGRLGLEEAKYALIHESLKRKKQYLIEKPFQDLPVTRSKGFMYSLDFDLTTQKPLKIQGLGLDSEWVGKNHCHIANQRFGLTGSLNCEKGEYRFNGKKFILEEGTIHFSEVSPSTLLAKGRLDIESYQIKVNLLGPLASPHLQFSSLPHLPENAIFSYILFNKPITQLHPFQTLELAQTLMELSGHQSPFSLSKIRSNLSIDTLGISSNNLDKNTLTLHIGKYLRPGLLLGLSQTSKSSDMLLQLELKHGFLLKAESKEQKEGKFSLKWNKTF